VTLVAYEYNRRGELVQPTDCPFRYQGQYEDTETGLYYNRFRYYDPESGQYISQDPISLLGGFNAYGYVTDTLVYTDALGLSQTYWLEKALNAAGRPLQPGQTAHHIVQINNPSKYAQASRDLLTRHGLHPDVASNGARLWGTHPNQVALASHPSRATARATGNYHAGSHIHSPTNDKLVYRTLRQAEKKGLNIEEALEDIGRKMESGSWKKGYKGCGHK
jgi:RHS repeat-associated protein